jgi:hypothetical protein
MALQKKKNRRKMIVFFMGGIYYGKDKLFKADA